MRIVGFLNRAIDYYDYRYSCERPCVCVCVCVYVNRVVLFTQKVWPHNAQKVCFVSGYCCRAVDLLCPYFFFFVATSRRDSFNPSHQTPGAENRRATVPFLTRL